MTRPFAAARDLCTGTARQRIDLLLPSQIFSGLIGAGPHHLQPLPPMNLLLCALPLRVCVQGRVAIPKVSSAPAAPTSNASADTVGSYWD